MSQQIANDVYRLDVHMLGPTAAGQAIALQPMTADMAQRLGVAFAQFGPWKHYGISASQLTASFLDASGGNRPFAATVGGALAGAVIVRDPFLLGPYLVFLGILPEFQGMKIGEAALGWFEAEARRAAKRNIWLCVTGNNEGAQRFYRRHGWEVAAMLPDLIRNGDDEIMMRKRLD